jgi:hypothetical protein
MKKPFSAHLPRVASTALQPGLLSDHPASRSWSLPNRGAASEIVRRKVLESKGGAAFGWHRATVGRLAAEIAGDALTDEA